MGTFFGQVQITPAHRGDTVTDHRIRRELEYQIGLGNLPAPNPNLLYMIYFTWNTDLVEPILCRLLKLLKLAAHWRCS